MSPPSKKQLKKGAFGYGDDPSNYEFLKVDNASGNWVAGASGHGYNARWDDDAGYKRGLGAYSDSDSGLVNKLPDELGDYAHERLAGLIDGQEDQPAGKAPRRWGSGQRQCPQ